MNLKLVSLSPLGEELAGQHVEAKHGSLKAFTHALSPEQRDQLHRVLTDILAGGVLVEVGIGLGLLPLGLGQHMVGRAARQLAAHGGDDAEAAGVVAAFGDLQVAVMARGELQPGIGDQIHIGADRRGRGGVDRGGDDTAERAADRVIAQIAERCGIPDLADRITVRRTITPVDFEDDLHAWRGTALGLAHTLGQRALFRPRNASKKVDGLFYAGTSALPGIGLPMCLISAELVLKRVRGDKTAGPLAPVGRARV